LIRVPAAFVADLGFKQMLGNHAAGRAAGLYGLDGLAAEDSAAEVENDVAQCDAERHLDELGKRTFPVTAKTFVPRDFLTPYWAYQGPPCTRIAGTAASVSTLLMAVGCRTGRARKDKEAAAGAAALALDRGDESGLLTQTNAPAPRRTLASKEKPEPRMLSPSRPEARASAMASPRDSRPAGIRRERRSSRGWRRWRTRR